MDVLKTRRKTVLSMTGPFIAHETILECQSCSNFFGSETLLQLVPKWCNVGYDVLVYIGRALFQRYRTIQEVRIELYSRNVQISDSEISYLGPPDRTEHDIAQWTDNAVQDADNAM